MSRSSLLLRCLLLGLMPGCASSAMSGSSAPTASPGSDEVATAGVSKEERFAEYKDADSDKAMVSDDTAMAPTLEQAAPVRSAPTGGLSSDGKLADPAIPEAHADQGTTPKGDDKKQYARQIIYTAELQLSVYKLDDAMQRAEELTLAAGGYVQNLAQGYYVLRIPAPALRGVMAELAKLGVVEARTLEARDVSEEYVDLTTRIRVLREIQSQLLALLKQARTVDDALKVRQSLDGVTMELERVIGRLRMLETLIGFSTLTVRMSQRSPQNAIPSSNDPFPWVDGLGVEATEWNGP